MVVPAEKQEQIPTSFSFTITSNSQNLTTRRKLKPSRGLFFFSVNPHLYFYFIMPNLHGSPLLHPGPVGINRRLQANIPGE